MIRLIALEQKNFKDMTQFREYLGIMAATKMLPKSVILNIAEEGYAKVETKTGDLTNTTEWKLMEIEDNGTDDKSSREY